MASVSRICFKKSIDFQSKASCFGVLVLGRVFLPPLVIAVLVPLAFLAVSHSGLLLTLLAAGTLAVGLAGPLLPLARRRVL